MHHIYGMYLSVVPGIFNAERKYTGGTVWRTYPPGVLQFSV